MMLERQFRDVFGEICIPTAKVQSAFRGSITDETLESISFSTPYVVNFLDFNEFYSLEVKVLRELIPITILGLINSLEEADNPITGTVFFLLDSYSDPNVWDEYFLSIWGHYSCKKYDVIFQAVSQLSESFMPWQYDRIQECLFFLKVRAEEMSKS